MQIVIRQKHFHSQLLPIEVITDNHLIVGSFSRKCDNFEEGVLDRGYITVINPDKPARSFQIVWNPWEKKVIVLFVDELTCESEYDDVLAIVKRVVEYWKGCLLNVNNKKMTIEEFEKMIEQIKEDCPNLIHQALEDVYENPTMNLDDFSILCARSILYPGKELFNEFLNDSQLYQNWITEKQSSDAYFLSAVLNTEEEKNILTYNIDLTKKLILPYKPRVPIPLIDKLEEQEFFWKINLFENEEFIATIDSLEELYAKIPEENKEAFDHKSWVLLPLTAEQIKQLFVNENKQITENNML